MKLNGIPIDKTPPVAQFLGGAGGFAQGFLGGLGAIQQLEARAQAMQSELEDRRRRERMLELAQQDNDLAVRRFDAQERARRRAAASKMRQRRDVSALNRTLLDTLMVDPVTGRSLRSPGAASSGAPTAPVQGPPAAPGLGGDYPAEWEAQDAELRRLADAGTLTPEQFAGAVKLHAASRGAAVRNQAATDLMQSVERDSIPGPDGAPFWSSMGALGLQVDYDEKTGPDPLEMVPAMVMDKLRAGEDPLAVAEWYQGVKDQIETQKNQRIAVQGVAQEITAEMGPQLTRLSARQRAEIMTELARFQRGDGEEYREFDEVAEQTVRARVGQIVAGTVPIRIGGKLVWTTPAAAEQIAADQSRGSDPGNPEWDRAKDELTLLARFIGEFKANPELIGPDNEPVPEDVQFERWLQRGAAVRKSFGFPPSRLSGIRTGATAVDPSATRDTATLAPRSRHADAALTPPEDPAETQKAMLPGSGQMRQPSGNAQDGATQTWDALKPEMQTAVRDGLTQAAQAVKGGQDRDAIRRLLAQLASQGFDVESLPEDLVAEIEAAFPKRTKKNMPPTPTAGDQPAFAREP